MTNLQTFVRLGVSCHVSFSLSTYIVSADTTRDMPKLCRVTKVKALFLVLVYVFNFILFEFSAAILEKCLLSEERIVLNSSLNSGKD